LEYTANLEANEVVHFAPASPGRIEKIFVEVGDKVRKGETIIHMDKTQLKQARIQLKNVESNFRRLDTLYKMNSVSEQQWEQAKTQFEVAMANVQFLDENTTMKSPINGIITDKYYEEKEMFSGAPNTASGKAAIVTIMQLNPLKAFVDIPARYYSEINKGMDVWLTLNTLEDTTFKGSITKIYPTIHQNTLTFKTEILIDNPERKLRPGMFARLVIELKRSESLVVPASTVLQEEGTNNRYVFVDDHGKARKINVNIGKRFNDKMEILSPELHEGMKLIDKGQTKLFDGASITVVKD
jgi:RND family efflux transporter MFP subunit